MGSNFQILLFVCCKFGCGRKLIKLGVGVCLLRLVFWGDHL